MLRRTRFLWINGWATTGEVWAPLFSEMAWAQHEVVEIGEWFSQAKGELDQVVSWAVQSIERHAQTAKEANESWALVGWSLGGVLAQRAIAEFKNIDADFCGLFLIGATTNFIAAPPTSGWPAAVVRRMQTQLLKSEQHTDVVLHHFFERAYEREAEQEIASTLSNIINIWRPEGLHLGLEALVTWDTLEIFEQLQRNRIPMFWLHGLKDSICPQGAINRSESMKGVVTTWESAGHAPFLEAPRLVSKWFGESLGGMHEKR